MNGPALRFLTLIKVTFRACTIVRLGQKFAWVKTTSSSLGADTKFSKIALDWQEVYLNRLVRVGRVLK